METKPAFLIREDSFSVQYFLDKDRGFRIQVTKPFTESLTIKDFAQGGLSDEAIGAALASILDIHAAADLGRIVFDNIAPESLASLSDKNMVSARFDQIAAVMRRWTEERSRTLENAYLDQRLGRFLAIFELG